MITKLNSGSVKSIESGGTAEDTPVSFVGWQQRDQTVVGVVFVSYANIIIAIIVLCEHHYNYYLPSNQKEV